MRCSKDLCALYRMLRGSSGSAGRRRRERRHRRWRKRRQHCHRRARAPRGEVAHTRGVAQRVESMLCSGGAGRRCGSKSLYPRPEGGDRRAARGLSRTAARSPPLAPQAPGHARSRREATPASTPGVHTTPRQLWPLLLPAPTRTLHARRTVGVRARCPIGRCSTRCGLTPPRPSRGEAHVPACWSALPCCIAS